LLLLLLLLLVVVVVVVAMVVVVVVVVVLLLLLPVVPRQAGEDGLTLEMCIPCFCPSGGTGELPSGRVDACS
jgi:hypothetical protein